jgi:hypothetical protein
VRETPIDLDKHRGMAAQTATDIRRVLAEVESKAMLHLCASSKESSKSSSLPGRLRRGPRR